jgi:ABC-type uncharacterized transport system involved in gliding motility auxiliary subunit
MKPALFVIPLVALFVGMIGTAIGSSFPDMAMASKIGWVVALALVALWLTLDMENFKRFLSRKGTKFGASSGVVLLLGALAIVGAGMLSNRPRFNRSFDATKGGHNTLSDQSVKVIENIRAKGQDVSVTAYLQDEAVKDEFRSLAALYLSLDAGLKIEYVDPQADPTRVLGEKVTAGNTVIFKLGNQESRITTFNEEKMTNALVSVLKEKTKKVYFTKGHGEGQIKGGDQAGYDFAVQNLENNKYQVDQVSLLTEAKVPDDADLLVIAGPEYDFKAEESAFVEAYLKKGGAVLAMVDAVRPVPNLNAVMEKFGIKFNSDLVIMGADDPRALLLGGRNNAIVSEFDDFSPVTKDFARQSQVDMIMPFTRSLTDVAGNPNAMKVVLAGKTADSMERVENVNSEADLQSIAPDRLKKGSAPVIAVATGKAQGPKVANSDANGKSGNAGENQGAKSDTARADGMAPQDKEIRLVAVGSSHFARNDGAQASAANRDLFVNISNYLLQDEDFISIRPKDPSKSSIALTTPSSQLTLTALSLIYPFLFLGSGVLFWLRRRNA